MGDEKTFPLSLIGEAAFFYVKEELERVYWNIFQKSFDELIETYFAGCHWRPYDWNWDLNLDYDKESPPQPVDFECLEVKFWWYKHPGRSMYTNVDYDGNQWAD